MSDVAILVLLGSLAVVLFGCVLLFYRQWDGAVLRAACAVDTLARNGETGDAVEAMRAIRREVAWLLDASTGSVLPRRDIDPQGYPCGVVVVLRGDCDPGRLATVHDVEGAVRAHVGVGVTFSIVTCPPVEHGLPVTRAA